LRVDIRDRGGTIVTVTDNETARQCYQHSGPGPQQRVEVIVATKSIRDSQRKKLYRAEWKAFFGTDKYEEDHTPHSLDFQTVPECQEYVDHVTASDAWKALDIWVEHVRVKDGRGRRKAGADSEGDTILLPKWSRVRWVILHELAHIANDYLYNFEVEENGDISEIYEESAAHGPQFAGVYLHLVREILSVQAHDKLLGAFEDGSVKILAVPSKTPEPIEVRVTDNDTATCLQCGMALLGSRSKFCSDACRWTYHNRLRHKRTEDDRQKVCVICAAEFTARRNDAKTCSARCRQRLRRQQH
jgi:putative metallohydrolase (TIGR04338 family)